MEFFGFNYANEPIDDGFDLYKFIYVLLFFDNDIEMLIWRNWRQVLKISGNVKCTITLKYAMLKLSH